MRRFGIIDLAAAAPLRSPLVRLKPPAARSLLDEGKFADAVPVGPWLIDLAMCPKITKAWKTKGKGQGWGYTFKSDQNFETLRRHFRKFNLVDLAGHKEPVMFRYFDPVVMLNFLQDASSEKQNQSFFSALHSVEFEDPEGKGVFEFFREDWG